MNYDDGSGVWSWSTHSEQQRKEGSCVSEYLVEESALEQAAVFFVACVMADGHV